MENSILDACMSTSPPIYRRSPSHHVVVVVEKEQKHGSRGKASRQTRCRIHSPFPFSLFPVVHPQPVISSAMHASPFSITPLLE